MTRRALICRNVCFALNLEPSLVDPSWMVVATSPSQIDEIRRADDDTPSPLEAARNSLHANLTIGPEPFDDPLNIDVIEGPRNIGAKFADVQMKLRQPTCLSKETLHFSLANTPFS
ncbi:hypothetical protein M378DRAFT_307121 [Amanita muscaria Koide BX008]|uniref:Uncharacterized protein n=1 Tax=Amanita muscaria (strain Koide BX008) TaxID=946122 RepID=A0A0C2SX30_AMAMK|nr:hypothetical protein M378DRAFT_307121 [Amanita muscaria Koide BX008]